MQSPVLNPHSAFRIPHSAFLSICFAAAVSAHAAPPADLRAASEALDRREFAEADAAFRKVFEAPEATAEQRARAFDGILVAAVALGRAAALPAYIEGRRAASPKDQQAHLVGALARALKARDGHLHAALALLEQETAKSNSYARRALYEVQAALPLIEKGVTRLARDLAAESSYRPHQAGLPRRYTREGSSRHALPELGRPAPTGYQVQLETLAPPPRLRVRMPPAWAGGEPARLRAPELPRLRADGAAAVAVTKPQPYPRPSSARLAAALFTQTYNRATELAGQGLVESAKAEYATLMQLFPDSPQAQQAARYAVHLFERERGAARGADALSAYLQWIRAVMGPTGSEFAEHLAFRSFADDTEPAVLAREAEDFLKRHPDSKWAPSIRLQLAIALDRTGATPRAIEVLKPLAAPQAPGVQDELRAKALHTLAWLYIFQGEAAPARATLEALAAQTADGQAAAAARRTLAAMAATPLPKLAIAEVVGPGDPDDLLAARILAVADAHLQKGDGERAMDLYELFLRVARESQDFRVVRDRIRRIKQTGRADEE